MWHASEVICSPCDVSVVVGMKPEYTRAPVVDCHAYKHIHSGRCGSGVVVFSRGGHYAPVSVHHASRRRVRCACVQPRCSSASLIHLHHHLTHILWLPFQAPSPPERTSELGASAAINSMPTCLVIAFAYLHMYISYLLLYGCEQISIKDMMCICCLC